MKIVSSTVNMSSSSFTAQETINTQTLKVWSGRQGTAAPPPKQLPGLSEQGLSQEVAIDISDEGRSMLGAGAQPSRADNEGKVVEIGISDAEKQKILLLQLLLEKLTGKKLKFILPEKIKLDSSVQITLPATAAPLSSGTPTAPGFGLQYDSYSLHYEKESVSFASTGVVRTADNREINFSVSLNMSREFASYHETHIRVGSAAKVDPLVINLSSGAPVLTDEKFLFDLDTDGLAEKISFTGQGSGFLAYDRNNDGTINDGSELFGPATGDGFQELSSYDLDKNSWIDENDSIYDKLRIWTVNPDGGYQLLALGAAGVGAIYLGSAATEFGIKNPQNILNGQVRKTGVYLREDGTAGTVQHIDLAL